MDEVSIIGIDLAKRSFQLHGARADGSVAFRKKLSRGKLLAFLASQPRCVVAMEACASAHYWGREIGKLGHEVRLIAPIYVKPFVKRQKNDAADAEAICEAAVRPSMRFVAVKGEAQQARAMLFRTRDLRRLLVAGAMSVVRGAVRRGETKDPWLAQMLARKPRMVVAVALANRMARIVWALTVKKEVYRLPAAA